jgi:hypothetical protein
MSDAMSSIGSAAVTTIGTVAVVGIAAHAIGRATGGSRGGGRAKKSNYHVFHGNKKSKHRSSKSQKSMIW